MVGMRDNGENTLSINRYHYGDVLEEWVYQLDKVSWWKDAYVHMGWDGMERVEWEGKG